MSPDIPALTFNQWIMAGTIVLFSIVLLVWVCLCVFSKKFRNSIADIDEDFPALTDESLAGLWLREMYEIWIGRIFDIAGTLAGRETKSIGNENLFSAMVWILSLVCITGYSSKFLNEEMWVFFELIAIVATSFYADMNAVWPFRKTRDKNI